MLFAKSAEGHLRSGGGRKPFGRRNSGEGRDQKNSLSQNPRGSAEKKKRALTIEIQNTQGRLMDGSLSPGRSPGSLTGKFFIYGSPGKGAAAGGVTPF